VGSRKVTSTLAGEVIILITGTVKVQVFGV
jgi:hypothetical protein